MSSSYFSLFDMAIAGIPVVVFCIWQLVSIDREIARDRAKKDSPGRASPECPSPEGSGHAVGEHRLDDR